MRPALRDDGATQGDRNEAFALVVAGACLLVLPGVVVADRLAQGWLWVAAVIATGATVVLGLGLRWFILEGPTLGTLRSLEQSGVVPRAPSQFPASLRLVEARNRMRAHALRFAAIGSGLLMLVIDVGAVGWLVVGLFGVSFAADHVLLRPKNYSVTEEDFGGTGKLTCSRLPLQSIVRVHWRRYPGEAKPPFPGGERVVIELAEERDVEFVFSPKYGGSAGEELVAALMPGLAAKIRILQPRSKGRERGSSQTMQTEQSLTHLAADGAESSVVENEVEAST